MGKWPILYDDRYSADTRVASTITTRPQISELPANNETIGKSCSESEDESDWETDATTDEWYDDMDDSSIQDKIRTGAKEASDFQDATMIEFLELLFQLSITLSKQEFLDGNGVSTLLIYFSSIFGFSSDYQHFLLAWQFCLSLSGLIYI